MPRTLEQSLSLRSKHTGSGEYTQEEIQQLVPALLEEIGESSTSSFKFLGAGFFGDVLWLGDKRKVLKVTNDYTDAYSSEIVRKDPDKSLVKVYKVFAFTDRYPAVYGIVNEKLAPLSSQEAAKIDNLREMWSQVIGKRTFFTRQNLDKFTDSPQIENVDDDDFDFLFNLIRVFEDRHIKWRDLSGDNVMMRGRQKVISDLGFSTSKKQSIPVLVKGL